MNSRSSSSGLPQEPQARQSSTPSSPPGAQANISPDQLQHYHTSLNEYISQAREHAQALRASYTNEVYELWHQHISTSAATDEASIASGSLTAQQLEELTRKWVRLMRESRDMLHHESTIAAARAAVEAKAHLRVGILTVGIPHAVHACTVHACFGKVQIGLALPLFLLLFISPFIQRTFSARSVR